MSEHDPHESADSELLLMQSSMISLSQIDTEIDTLARLNDTSETVADLINVVPSIESATDTELYLLNTNAYMASAGTDLSSHDIARTLSRYRGKRVSVEGFKTFLSGVWRTILEALKRVWQATIRFFKAVFGFIPRMRASMFLLRRRLREKPQYDDKRPLKISLKDELYILATKNKAPKTPEKISETIDILIDHADFYFGEFLTVAKQTYDDVVTGIEHFDNDHEDTTLNLISADAIQIAQRNYPPLFKPEKVSDSRFSGEYLMCPPLPNNKSVFIRRVDIPDTSEPLWRANAIMQNYVSIMPTKAEPSDEEWKVRELATPDSRTLNFWLDKVDLLLDKAEEFQKVFDGIGVLRTRLINATDDLIERLEELDPHQSSTMPYYRCAIRYNSYLSTAFIHPCTSLMNIVFSACRAVLVISQKAVKSIDPVVPAR